MWFLTITLMCLSPGNAWRVPCADYSGRYFGQQSIVMRSYDECLAKAKQAGFDERLQSGGFTSRDASDVRTKEPMAWQCIQRGRSNTINNDPFFTRDNS